MTILEKNNFKEKLEHGVVKLGFITTFDSIVSSLNIDQPFLSHFRDNQLSTAGKHIHVFLLLLVNPVLNCILLNTSPNQVTCIFYHLTLLFSVSSILCVFKDVCSCVCWRGLQATKAYALGYFSCYRLAQWPLSKLYTDFQSFRLQLCCYSFVGILVSIFSFKEGMIVFLFNESLG